MIPPHLPAELRAALEARLEGLSRNDVAARAASISKTYRDGGSSAAIKSGTDALAADHRREEIARMLAGAEITAEARAAAERLLRAATA